MKSLVVGAIGVWLLAALAGCNKDSGSGASGKPSSGPAGPIGVVDLDRTAKVMGWQEEMTKNMQSADADLRRQLDARVVIAREAYNEKKRQLARDANFTKDQADSLNKGMTKGDLEKLGLSAKQVDELIQSSSNYGTEMRYAQSAYQQIMNQRRVVMVNAYRDAVGPVIRRVAAAAGRSAVFTPNDNLIYYDLTTDITDKVIDELQKMPPIKISVPDLPKLDLPATQQGTQATTAPTTQQ